MLLPPRFRTVTFPIASCPDKAIDLIDEAAAGLRMQIDSLPTEIDEIERRIMQLEIERQALRKETDHTPSSVANNSKKNWPAPRGFQRAQSALAS